MAGFNPRTWPTFQQSMPITQGAMTGEELIRRHLQNQQQKQQNQAQPGMDAAKLAKILQYNQAQPGLDEAKLSQMQATTEGTKLSTQQAPEKLGLQEYLAQIAAQNASHGMQNIQLQRDKMAALYANAFARAARIPAMQEAMANRDDPSVMGHILSALTGFSGKFAQVEGGQGPLLSEGGAQPVSQPQNAMQQALQKAFQKSMQQPQEQPMPVPNFPALQQYLQGQQAAAPQQIQQDAPQQTQQPIPPTPAQQPQQEIPAQQQQGGISPELISRAQDATASAEQKATQTAQILNQRHFALNLKAIGDPLEEKLKAVSKYFGLTGKAAYAEDIAKGKAGNTPPELKIYRQLVKDDFPLYANEFGRAAGNNATDQQKKAMAKMVTPDWLLSNPDLALSTFQGLRDNERKIDKQLSKSLAQTQRELSEAGSQTGQQPQSQPSLSPPVVSAAPAGTVEMIDDQGLYHAVDQSDVDGATKHGWKKANG